ncbi:DNA-binding domain-containing protein [Paraburkholderia sp. C35]|uniref:HvfC/BufC N-terminal domain-containing protein n=1 Tax=Paraburkholderia sp. C35 TaxID=2126993 RepID=UPI000D68D364|nr:DNA-binding domain-containing protein [Paraburkholderia sp. C35]
MKASLADTQQAFCSAVRDAREDAALSGRLSTPPNIVSGRLSLYRRNVQSAWLAALKNAYPVLLALTGERYFTGLAQGYAKDHPSESGDLNQYGAHLPEFIERWEQNALYGYFGDVARLEWAVHNAWYAADPRVTSTQQWQETGSERLLNSRLTTHPACSAMRSRHSIGDIWRAHQPGGDAPRDIDAAACVLVVRPHWRPVVVDQTLAAHDAFLALQHGRTLNEAIDVGLEANSAFDIAAQLQVWISIAAVTGMVGA